MTPVGSPIQTPDEPWQGDQNFVWFEVITLLLGFLVAGLFLPTAMNQMPSRSGAHLSGAQAESAVLGALACVMIIVIPIEIAVLTGIWKGKQWAYVVLTILLLCGGLSQLSRLGGNPKIVVPNYQVMAMFGFIIGVGKLIFCGMRLAGAIGPPLK
ncbi:MAG: hypothetical protein WCG75_02890 [Armatimonadota bacterium]